MKKLRLAALVLGVSLFTNSISAFELPQRFRDYKKTKCGETHLSGKGSKTLFGTFCYDMGCDKKIDVEEIFYYEVSSKNPLIYGFDLNGNGKIEQSEYFWDSKVDGLNGNEIPVLSSEKIDL